MKERIRQIDEGGTRFEIIDEGGKKKIARFSDEGKTRMVIE